MILYNLKTTTEHTFTITKFDDDMNVESSYLVSEIGCSCPQGHKSTCRHRWMLSACVPIVDTEFYYCFDSKTYHDLHGQVITLAEHQKATKALLSLGESQTTSYTPAPIEPTRFRRRI